MDKKRILIYIFVAIAFISIVSGGILLVLGAINEIINLVYIAISTITLGVIIYAVLICLLLFKTVKENR